MSLAVGVMARAPVPGACKTRLLKAYPPEWVAGLYAAMLADTLQKLGGLGAASTTIFLAPGEGAESAFAAHRPAGWGLRLQEGPGLGARLEHAFAALFAGGATCALVCGSDAPTFAVAPLAAGLARMAGGRDQILLGPCADGGYALIALTRAEPRLFRAMTWSSLRRPRRDACPRCRVRPRRARATDGARRRRARRRGPPHGGARSIARSGARHGAPSRGRRSRPSPAECGIDGAPEIANRCPRSRGILPIHE